MGITSSKYDLFVIAVGPFQWADTYLFTRKQSEKKFLEFFLVCNSFRSGVTFGGTVIEIYLATGKIM